MRYRKFLAGGLVATLALLSTGCATTFRAAFPTADPAGTVTATGRTLAARGVEGVDWQRTEQAEESAREKSRTLLEQPLTTDLVSQVVLLRSHDLRAELAALGIAQAELAQASRLANPGVSFARLSGDGETMRTTGLTADIVDWLTQPLRRRMAEAELEQVKLEVASAVFDHVAEAQHALIQLQAALAETRIRSQVEEAERAAADYAIALHEAGNLTRRERTLVEASWLERKAEVADSEVRRLQAEEALRRALGLGPEDAWRVEPLAEPPTMALEVSIRGLEDLAVDQRLDLSAARWSLAMLERARNLHRKTRWLPVGVELGIERETETDGVRLTGPTVELALPIFESGRASQARYDVEILRARSQLAGLEMQVRSEVRQTRGAYLAALEMAELHGGSLIPLRRQALELTLHESHQMLVGVFEVLSAKQDLLDSQLRHVEAVQQAWLSHVELHQALGSWLAITPEVGTATSSDQEMNR